MGIRGSETRHVDASPDDVFAVITDLSRLPEWNARMTGVVELPDELRQDAEWVVGFTILGRRFTSRSHVIELDRNARRFVYRSKQEDSNPSFAVWTWQVDPDRDGSLVTLEWDLRPVTFLRKRVIVPLRGLQIERSEAGGSLAALARVCEAFRKPAPPAPPPRPAPPAPEAGSPPPSSSFSGAG